MKRKIRTYRREASYYKSEERNGTETAESTENPGANEEGNDKRKRRMRIRRRKNEANGVTGREEEEDEGMCVTKTKAYCVWCDVTYRPWYCVTYCMAYER